MRLEMKKSSGETRIVLLTYEAKWNFLNNIL